MSRRAAAGEAVTFGGALDHASGDGLDDVEALLKKLEPTVGTPLRTELANHRARHVNLGLLRNIGIVWGSEPPSSVIVQHEQLDQAASLIEQSLTGERRRSVIVSGDAGSGKSTVIRAAASRLHAAGWTIFEAGAAELLAGQSYIGQLENRLLKLVRNMSGARRVAWIVPNLHELQYAGAYRQNPTAILDTLLPEIDAGAIAVIGEVSTQAWTRLVEQKPGVRSAFVNVRLEALPDDATRHLAREWTRRRELQLPDEVLTEAWQLTTQFLGTRAAPGNLLGLLQLAKSDKDTITLEDLLVALSRQTGLPLSILDEREGLDPRALREHVTSRVIGQPEAVDVLVERVAMIKAGLTDPTRPLGVFLFAGPTGTGKTELAKVLASYLFGAADRMIRVDMSELQTAESLSRLVGDSEGSVVSLADQVRRQPFSVVLLDEIEKAHRNVLDLFLQVFDDGRLTDRRGNVGDFRHTIVILTSNLGSAIRTGVRVFRIS
jgi:ATP-dependent Clp protease ATP-binding subunit ClpC